MGALVLMGEGLAEGFVAMGMQYTAVGLANIRKLTSLPPSVHVCMAPFWTSLQLLQRQLPLLPPLSSATAAVGCCCCCYC